MRGIVAASANARQSGWIVSTRDIADGDRTEDYGDPRLQLSDPT